MKVEVTQEHIDRGQRKAHCYCPVALALKDVGVKEPVVFGGYFRALGDTEDTKLPPKVDDFVLAYDLGLKVTPFTFDLDLSDPSN